MLNVDKWFIIIVHIHIMHLHNLVKKLIFSNVNNNFFTRSSVCYVCLYKIGYCLIRNIGTVPLRWFLSGAIQIIKLLLLLILVNYSYFRIFKSTYEHWVHQYRPSVTTHCKKLHSLMRSSTWKFLKKNKKCFSLSLNQRSIHRFC